MQEAYMIGYVYISGFYADMTNPKNRGRCWSWNKFADLALERVEHGLHIKNVRLDTGLHEVVISDLREYAVDLVKRGGWLDEQEEPKTNQQE